MSFTVYDPSYGPEDARPLLQKAKSAYGFVPNILGFMAASPVLLLVSTGLGPPTVGDARSQLRWVGAGPAAAHGH